jgi:hypothetical protein
VDHERSSANETRPLLFAVLATLIIVLFPASQVTLSEKTSATVKVDCAKGDSINTALLSNAKAQGLIIEISGMCHDTVADRSRSVRTAHALIDVDLVSVHHTAIALGVCKLVIV